MQLRRFAEIGVGSLVVSALAWALKQVIVDLVVGSANEALLDRFGPMLGAWGQDIAAWLISLSLAVVLVAAASIAGYRRGFRDGSGTPAKMPAGDLIDFPSVAGRLAKRQGFNWDAAASQIAERVKVGKLWLGGMRELPGLRRRKVFSRVRPREMKDYFFWPASFEGWVVAKHDVNAQGEKIVTPVYTDLRFKISQAEKFLGL